MDLTVGISINLAVDIKLPSWRGGQVIHLDSVNIDQSWQKLFKDQLGINDPFILKGRRHRVDETLPIRIYYEQFRWQWSRYKISVLPVRIVPAKKSRGANMSRKRKTETIGYQEVEFNIDNNSPPMLFPISPFEDVQRYLEFETEQTRMRNDKLQVKNIRKYFADRIKDTDILKIRSELNDVKRRGNYIELIRIASFTAGFLESCFL